MRLVPASVRGLALFALLNAAADAAFLPLVPSIRDDLGLSGLETGALLAATTLAVLVATIPAGALAARHGSRSILLAAALLMPVSLLAMAASSTIAPLLAGRVLFGLSFAVAWSIAPGVAAVRAPGATGTATLLAAAGLGWLVGPASAGLLASASGWRLPLVVLAAATALATLPFVRRGVGDEHARPTAPPPLREVLRRVRTSPAVGWAAVVAGLLGTVTGAIGVLVPAALADNGTGPGGIGAAVTASAVVWVAASAASGRVGGRRIGLPLVGVTVAALAAACALPALSSSTGVLVAFLVLAAACRAPLGALIYPLATRASDGEAGATAIASLLNLAWAAPALVAPLLAGVALQQGLQQLAFGAVCAVAVLVAAGILSSARRPVTA